MLRQNHSIGNDVSKECRCESLYVDMTKQDLTTIFCAPDKKRGHLRGHLRLRGTQVTNRKDATRMNGTYIPSLLGQSLGGCNKYQAQH